MDKKINAMYFSPTETTKKVVLGIAKKIAEATGPRAIVHEIDFTFPGVRKIPAVFTQDDVVVVGTPVIAGRVPNVLLKYLNTFEGNGALAVPVVLYGNRNYDDALIELRDILDAKGFQIVAGAAFIGEHSFSRILGKNRPDEKDMAIASSFAGQIYKKITTQDPIEVVDVKGERPLRDYYKPKSRAGEPVDIRKVTPKTNDNCIHCKLCVALCPFGSLDLNDESKLTGICIKCCACVKRCPVQAKYFDDPNYLWHQQELEIDFENPRKEPELFI